MSEYFSTLSGDVKTRYAEKLKIIGDIDPYSLHVQELSSDLSILPDVGIIDLVSYLVFSHSFYTGEQLKAYKSLQAYKFYEAGFVQEVLTKPANDAFIILGKVSNFYNLYTQLWKINICICIISSVCLWRKFLISQF